MPSSPQPQSAHHEAAESETSRERAHEDVQSSRLCDLLQMETPREKIELPPIPSFAEFAKNAKAGESVHSNTSTGVRKRPMESEKHGRTNQEKKISRR